MSDDFKPIYLRIDLSYRCVYCQKVFNNDCFLDYPFICPDCLEKLKKAKVYKED